MSLPEGAGVVKTFHVNRRLAGQTPRMSTSIQSSRTDAAPAAPAGARAGAAARGGQWLLIGWGVMVVLCLAFWVGVVSLLVAVS